MYESRRQPLLSLLHFLQRIALHIVLSIALLLFSLVFGMAGYRITEHMAWDDAFLNVAMLLGGMGPVNPPQTEVGKIFAGVFALYAGLVFIVCAAVVLTPVLHRVLHHFHLEDGE